ncbi:unnamed protein product [Trichogramma brassicae]|uniref:Uncharacterized protein n=1 Tax=Trichogramma brassicae TaxID=86971 RepID=A0A6H5I092_9HYME|nr:unnamed protein product [Trichogramma brassicae]
MTMFGSLVQRLTSPVTSPTSSRRRFKSSSRWEAQSEPEDEATGASSTSGGSGPSARKSRAAKQLLNKRKSKSRCRGLEVSEPQACSWQDQLFPPLRATKSLGRLDGMKEHLMRSEDKRPYPTPRIRLTLIDTSIIRYIRTSTRARVSRDCNRAGRLDKFEFFFLLNLI